MKKIYILVLTLICVNLWSVELNAIYNKENIDPIMKEVELWINENESVELNKEQGVSWGMIQGYFYAIKSAQAKIDDPKVVLAGKISLCNLCYGYGIQMVRIINSRTNSSITFIGKVPNFMALAVSFNGGGCLL